MAEIDAPTQAFIAMSIEAGGQPLPELSPAEAREVSNAGVVMAGEPPAVHSAEDIVIPGPGGELHGRIYQPEAQEPQAVVVWFHGGGWVVGSPINEEATARWVAKESGALVVNADYRHAPEDPFPAAADDAIATVKWVADNIANGRPIVVAGNSAGGNLAAVAALRACEEGGPAIAYQGLIYPVTDHDFETDSYNAHATQIPLGKGEMIWFWDHYVPNKADRYSPYASPLRATDLSGLPAAYVTVAGFDPLHDEGLAYAKAMQQAGVDVTIREDPGTVHGYVSFLTMLPAGREVIAELGTKIKALVA